MGKNYSHLSLEERVEIYRLHAGGISQRKIGEGLGRSPSTISRELKRNSKPTKVWKDGYEPVRAQGLADRRRRWDCRHKLARQPALRELVGKSLAMGHSPEQIAGRLTRENADSTISHESIYRYIYHRSAQKDYWHRQLPCRKARRGRRGRKGGSPASFIKFRRPITERPDDVVDRSTPGHWEADCMLFSAYGQNLLVLSERQTRFIIIDHPPDRKAELIAERITNALRDLPQRMRRTISFDNGTEFAEHYRLHSTLGVETFFCRPHSPWEKGGVENAIGRARRILPRKTDISTLSTEQIEQIAQRLNHTPRKCLDFKTPAEAFAQIVTVALQP